MRKAQRFCWLERNVVVRLCPEHVSNSVELKAPFASVGGTAN